MSKSKTKFYVVWVGVNPGVYDSWADCQKQIKGFPNAKYKSFKTKEAAQAAFKDSAMDHIFKKQSKKTAKPQYHNFLEEIVHNSISVDAACSNNPGIMEYRGVITTTGEELFRMGPFQEGTNNVGEFLALVQALAYLKKIGKENINIYSDSRTAIAWVRNKKTKTTLKQTPANKDIFTLLQKASNWLLQNEVKTKILKWDTEKWGEIPADFGRK